MLNYQKSEKHSKKEIPLYDKRILIIYIQCGIESVKTAADVYAPVNGQVTAVNDNIGSDPAVINKAAEKEGWLFKVKVDNERDLGIQKSM